LQPSFYSLKRPEYFGETCSTLSRIIASTLKNVQFLLAHIVHADMPKQLFDSQNSTKMATYLSKWPNIAT